jgi:hypothetical protein
VATTLAEVLRHFGPEYLRSHSLSTAQAKAWRAIVSCRTPALGGQLLRCDGCGQQQWRWHSCRNRHCPQCQAQAREAWRQARLRELLDVPYCHLVFTLPHQLNALAGAHPRWVYETLMQCTAATLSEFAANDRWLGGTGAFTLVLHTWRQDLRRHVHAHALMACGALKDDDDGCAHWVAPKRAASFLFPVRALSQVFRGKFLAALQQATQAQALPRDPAQSAQAVRAEFVARLLQHVLPQGFKRIRHYGLLAPAGKSERLARARAVLRMPQPNPQAAEDAQAFMRRVVVIDIGHCPHCSSGRLQLICERPVDRMALARVPPLACRGPP